MDKNICTRPCVSRSSQKDCDPLSRQGTGDRRLPQQKRQGSADQKAQTHYLLLSFFSFITIFIFSPCLKAEPITVNAENAQHIQFKRIPATQYHFDKDTLEVKVDNSASFLLLPFKQKKTVHAVSFDWQLDDGKLNLVDAAEELKRAGDDSIFKLGLMLEGQAQLPLAFAPSWLQQVNAALAFPSEKIIYIVAGAKHAAGEHWINPYNKRIEMIAAEESKLDTGWSKASYVFTKPLSVVGLWLMADGDNSQSSFNARIKNIRLE
jgi:hypothetical protein